MKKLCYYAVNLLRVIHERKWKSYVMLYQFVNIEQTVVDGNINDTLA